MVFGFAFCQTILPVAASIAKSVLSLPTTKTRVAGPCGVFTVATTGAVIVERMYSFGEVEIWAVHFTSSPETLPLFRIFSSGFDPVRSGSWPHVNHSLWAIASPGNRKSANRKNATLAAKPKPLTNGFEMHRRPLMIFFPLSCRPDFTSARYSEQYK